MTNLGAFANQNSTKQKTSFTGLEIVYGDYLVGAEWWGLLSDLRGYCKPDVVTGSTDGLMSAADKVILDGLVADGPFLDEAPIDGSEYTRKNAGWVVPSAAGISEAPNNGSMYVRASLGWSVLPAAGISDAPNDGQEYTRKSLGWQVASSSDTSRVSKGTTIVGPLTHPFVTGDIGKKFECDCTAGIVEILFDDQATVASGYQALAFFKRIGTQGGSALKFTAGTTVAGGTITLGTPVAAGASTNGGTDLSTNTKKTFTIPAGANVALGIAYFGIANTSLVDAVSAGFKLNVGSGSDPTTHYDWGAGSSSDPSLSRVRCWSRILPLATLGVDTAYDWLPEWGSPSNITSYTVIFFWAYGVNQTNPSEAVQALQYNSATSQSLSYSNIPSGDLGRKVVYAFGRRSNALVSASPSTISLSGATLDIQGASGNNNTQSNRYCVGHEDGADGLANTATMTWDSSLSVPYASIVWAFNPAPSTMGMTIKGTAGNVASTTTTNANHTVPVLYDQTALTVEVQL